MSRLPHGAFPALAAAALLPVLAAAADVPGEPSVPAEEGAQALSTGQASGSSLDESGNPCLEGVGDETPYLERMRAGVFTGVCWSSRWLDGFFGDPRDYAEVYGQTYGRAGIGLLWDEKDDVGVDGYLRARFPLPALGERYNAILGRDSEEAILDESFDEGTFLPGAFSDESFDSVWYAGISYARLQGENHRTDLSVGVKFGAPVNPYVRYRYRYHTTPHDSLLLRLRVTPFWEREDGLGISVAADSDWSFSEGWMLRWANAGTYAEGTEGVRWRSRLALFQVLNRKSAMRYEVAVRGETRGIQPRLYGGKLSYRRSLWRDWFFLETSATLFWSREENPAEDCDACVGVGVGFEVAFGERYDRVIENARDTSVSSEDGPQDVPGFR